MKVADPVVRSFGVQGGIPCPLVFDVAGPVRINMPTVPFTLQSAHRSVNLRREQDRTCDWAGTPPIQG